MRRIAVIGLLCCAIGGGVSPVVAEESDPDEKKRALALEVMQVTGATDFGDEVAATLLGQLRPAYPTVPDEIWGELASTFSVQEIVDLSIPIYLRNFEEEDLRHLVSFYKSPTGRKVIARMPIVMQESMQVFGEWQQRRATEVMEKLSAAGYEPQAPQMLQTR